MTFLPFQKKFFPWHKSVVITQLSRQRFCLKREIHFETAKRPYNKSILGLILIGLFSDFVEDFSKTYWKEYFCGKYPNVQKSRIGQMGKEESEKKLGFFTHKYFKSRVRKIKFKQAEG